MPLLHLKRTHCVASLFVYSQQDINIINSICIIINMLQCSVLLAVEHFIHSATLVSLKPNGTSYYYNYIWRIVSLSVHTYIYIYICMCVCVCVCVCMDACAIFVIEAVICYFCSKQKRWLLLYSKNYTYSSSKIDSEEQRHICSI